MRLRLAGKQWILRFVPHLAVNGDCDSPDTRNKTIRIAQQLRGEERLAVLIHEMLHATNWNLDETWVEKASTDIARALWRLGYRA